jgi:hypothetical protein
MRVLNGGWAQWMTPSAFFGFGVFQVQVSAHHFGYHLCSHTNFLGKTHLSSLIVDKIKKSSSKCLFVFLSYKHRQTLSATSLLHSLLVQLVGDDETLQPVLCKLFQAHRSELKGNINIARDVLSKLIRCAGPLHIVVDGLDEVEEGERRVILDALLKLLTECSLMRLCISSRPEHDLSRALKVKAEIVQVDQNNSGCIQKYVTHRIEQWFDQQLDVTEEDCAEIQSFLAPLSSKARGQFC